MQHGAVIFCHLIITFSFVTFNTISAHSVYRFNENDRTELSESQISIFLFSSELRQVKASEDDCSSVFSVPLTWHFLYQRRKVVGRRRAGSVQFFAALSFFSAGRLLGNSREGKANGGGSDKKKKNAQTCITSQADQNVCSLMLACDLASTSNEPMSDDPVAVWSQHPSI